MIGLNKLLIERRSIDRFKDEYYKDVSTFQQSSNKFNYQVTEKQSLISDFRPRVQSFSNRAQIVQNPFKYTDSNKRTLDNFSINQPKIQEKSNSYKSKFEFGRSNSIHFEGNSGAEKALSQLSIFKLNKNKKDSQIQNNDILNKEFEILPSQEIIEPKIIEEHKKFNLDIAFDKKEPINQFEQRIQNIQNNLGKKQEQQEYYTQEINYEDKKNDILGQINRFRKAKQNLKEQEQIQQDFFIFDKNINKQNNNNDVIQQPIQNNNIIQQPIQNNIKQQPFQNIKDQINQVRQQMKHNDVPIVKQNRKNDKFEKLIQKFQIQIKQKVILTFKMLAKKGKILRNLNIKLKQKENQIIRQIFNCMKIQKVQKQTVFNIQKLGSLQESIDLIAQRKVQLQSNNRNDLKHNKKMDSINMINDFIGRKI